MLEDIGEGDDALLCITNQSACCRSNDTGGNASGNWYFPNGNRVPSAPGVGWDIYRSRGQLVVRLNRRRGGVEGIYSCVIPDAMNVIRTIYIGVYSASTGKWSILFCSANGWDSSTIPWLLPHTPNTCNNVNQQCPYWFHIICSLCPNPTLSQGKTVW